MQISFVMLIFLLFSDQISGGQTASGAPPAPLWKKASYWGRFACFEPGGQSLGKQHRGLHIKALT